MAERQFQHISTWVYNDKEQAQNPNFLVGFGEKPVTETDMTLETIEPVGLRVLIRKDAEKRTTRGGIHLPDDAKTPVLTGRVVAISAQIESDPDYPLQQYDKVLIDPRNGIPVDFEQDNRLFIVPVEDVVAVFRKEEKNNTS